MMMRRFAVPAALILAAGSVPASVRAGDSSPWLHIRVEESNRASKVHVNLPLSVVQAALAVAPDRIVSRGQIRLDVGRRHDLSVADLRRMWTELRAAGDADIVTVDNEDETVSVSQAGSLVRVQVKEKKGTETVHVEVPARVVDALLAGEGDELDIRGAMAELHKVRGDVVRVTDKDSTVRIWIDERN